MTILGLDIGTKRTGVAKAVVEMGIASPLVTLENPDTLSRDVANLVEIHDAQAVIIGRPRSLSGEVTAQTEYTEAKAREIEAAVQVPVYLIDEALTSVKAEDELARRKKPYTKADVDMLAATYILEDYMAHRQGKANV